MVSQRIIKQRESLPIFQFRQKIVDAIKSQNLLVIIGETGNYKKKLSPFCLFLNI
jgi:HrpA-like RNA helicase